MIRHIFALLAFVITLGTFWFLFEVDKEVDAIGNVNEIFRKSDLLVELGKKSSSTGVMSEIAPVQEKEDDEDKLKALKDKAGNVGKFKVSSLYKIKCASCHGINGEGSIGPKIIGLSYEKISKSLDDFKSGEKKNYVMYGLLQNISEAELIALAKEISEFSSKVDGK